MGGEGSGDVFAYEEGFAQGSGHFARCLADLTGATLVGLHAPA